MKIFENNQNEFTTNKMFYISRILENNFSLKTKMLRLQSACPRIKSIPNGENELIKMIFENMGSEIYFPRKGDNSERFDSIIQFDGYKAVAEIEIPSTEILDAPRNLLDDYAVLYSRNGEHKTKIIPLVICWKLPNKRTDYWNVISDIENILKIRIKTISVLALAFYYWTGNKLDLTDDEFYLCYNNTSMKKTIDLLKQNCLSPDSFPGFFTPLK